MSVIQNAIFICGPTASGKTSLAIELARRLQGEIVNADAYQLYQGLEIISAAPSADELSQACHHLYGVLNPSDLCDAMRFREMALPVLQEIQSRHKIPIITGGAGMYLKFLTHGPSPVPSGDENLRQQLEKKSDSQLVTQLTELDPEGATITNLKNRRYEIRALEICLLSGQKMSELKSDWKNTSVAIEKNLRGIYLNWEPETLRQRINLRTEVMLKNGAIEEVASLENPSATCVKAIGVPQIQAHLADQLTYDECVERIAAATRQYAKRQRTWFRKEQWLTPYAVDDQTDMAALAEEISRQLG